MARPAPGRRGGVAECGHLAPAACAGPECCRAAPRRAWCFRPMRSSTWRPLGRRCTGPSAPPPMRRGPTPGGPLGSRCTPRRAGFSRGGRGLDSGRPRGARGDSRACARVRRRDGPRARRRRSGGRRTLWTCADQAGAVSRERLALSDPRIGGPRGTSPRRSSPTNTCAARCATISGPRRIRPRRRFTSGCSSPAAPPTDFGQGPASFARNPANASAR